MCAMPTVDKGLNVLLKGQGINIWCIANATFYNISAISWWSVLLVEEIGVPQKTIDLAQVTDKLYHIMLYRVHSPSDSNFSGDSH